MAKHAARATEDPVMGVCWGTVRTNTPAELSQGPGRTHSSLESSTACGQSQMRIVVTMPRVMAWRVVWSTCAQSKVTRGWPSLRSVNCSRRPTGPEVDATLHRPMRERHWPVERRGRKRRGASATHFPLSTLGGFL